MEVRSKYIAAGGNRHPSAADWDVASGLLAFGSDRNIALWEPLNNEYRGVTQLLCGHNDKVNAVRFFGPQGLDFPVLVTGSSDKSIRVWTGNDPAGDWICQETLTNHAASINCLAVIVGTSIFVSGAADGTLKTWGITTKDRKPNTTHLSSLTISPRFFPLAISAQPLGGQGLCVLAVGGTKNVIEVYLLDTGSDNCQPSLQATLLGHEGWIRSLSFIKESDGDDHGDLILASASQDKYIRLWRIHKGVDLPGRKESEPETAPEVLGGSLTNRAYHLKDRDRVWSVTFEALLFGHDDWVYTVAWKRIDRKLYLLSASADSTLCVWQADLASGIWLSITRLGEINATKGSTTATGSTGGYWIALWSPDGSSITSLGRTGSWRVWKHDATIDRWDKHIGISGHVKDVRSLAWAKNSSYLLSTSADQTTRLHAEWIRDNKRTWHEMTRPQIHGFDLNCIDTSGSSQFVSGADEKLLRVFDEPKSVAELLGRLSGINSSIEYQEMPNNANIPVLGLSNKAIETDASVSHESQPSGEDGESSGITLAFSKLSVDRDYPPQEDLLSRHTLWPEKEKLYGHGYEISAIAASYDGRLIATACKASSIHHAAIRIYETQEWREVKPALTAHSLTITSLAFAGDDEYLLSAGRDRQWSVFSRENNGNVYTEYLQKPKGHSRMILDVSWASMEAGGRIFATAGREKTIKIWRLEGPSSELLETISMGSSVTAIDFLYSSVNGKVVLAAGTEDGELTILLMEKWTMKMQHLEIVAKKFSPSLAVNQLSWRPSSPAIPIQKEYTIADTSKSAYDLAVASADSSLRILSIKIPPLR
ncbi:hypothetical protein MMC25_006454 [Agyrium rufum]|nr:hypothetical protein [Agyrium rufum]